MNVLSSLHNEGYQTLAITKGCRAWLKRSTWPKGWNVVISDYDYFSGMLHSSELEYQRRVLGKW